MPWMPVVDQKLWSRAVRDVATRTSRTEEQFLSSDWDRVRSIYKDAGGEFRTVSVPEPVLSGEDDNYSEVDGVPRVSGLMTASAPESVANIMENREHAAHDYEQQGASAAADFIRFAPPPVPSDSRKKRTTEELLAVTGSMGKLRVPKEAESLVEGLVEGEKPSRKHRDADPIRNKQGKVGKRGRRGRSLPKETDDVDEMIKAIMNGEDSDTVARKLSRKVRR